MRRSIILRFLRVSSAGFLAAALPLIPGLSEIFPSPYRPFMSAILAGAVVAGDKYLRDFRK